MRSFFSIVIIVFVLCYSSQSASAHDRRHHNHRHDRLAETLVGVAVGTALSSMYYHSEAQQPRVIYVNDARESQQRVERFHNHHPQTLQNAFEAGRRDTLRGRSHRGFKCCKEITDAYSEGYASIGRGRYHARW